jgi:hypothetical protein
MIVCASSMCTALLKGMSLIGKGKSEDHRVRYIKSASKLHNVHNEYVTTLQEVTLHQQNYMTTFLPQLLQYEQFTLQSEATLM